MGYFENGGFAKVWDVKPVSDKCTKLRISCSQKNKDTGEYIERFSGYVNVLGTVMAKRASALKNGDSIKLVRVACETVKDEETKKVKYYNFFIFEFEQGNVQVKKEDPVERAQSKADSGEVDDSRLPF